MRKKITSFFAIAVLFVVLVSGCGKADMDKAQSAAPQEKVAIGATSNKSAVRGYYDADKGDTQFTVTTASSNVNNANGVSEGENSDGIVDTGSESNSVANKILSERKIIRTANLSIEVESFDKTYGKIQSVVEFADVGFVQEMSVGSDKIYIDEKERLIKSGTIIVRVRAEKFSKILDGIKGLGTLRDMNIGSEDVTERFYDVDSELRLLKYEQRRLEEYLHKIKDPDTIFKTEDKLTEIRHQIESLTGTLKKLGNLVELSTITINVNEKKPNPTSVENIEKQQSYFGKLFSSFGDSIKSVVGFFGDVLIFIAQAIPVLLVIVLILWAAFALYKRVFKKFIKKNFSNENDNDINEQL